MSRAFDLTLDDIDAILDGLDEDEHRDLYDRLLVLQWKIVTNDHSD